MQKILDLSQVESTAHKLKQENKTIVLAGGCFDILHSGHIKFLKESKEKADVLILLLESDENIRKLKGIDRPINSQINRSIVLSTLNSVDYIVMLEGMTKGEEYDKLIVQIRPDFIAITKGDKNLKKRLEQCKKVGSRLIEIDKLEGASSTAYIKQIT